MKQQSIADNELIVDNVDLIGKDPYTVEDVTSKSNKGCVSVSCIAALLMSRYSVSLRNHDCITIMIPTKV